MVKGCRRGMRQIQDWLNINGLLMTVRDAHRHLNVLLTIISYSDISMLIDIL